MRNGRSILPFLISTLLLASCTETVDEGNFVGYVEGEYIYVAPPQSGWLVSLPVKEGDSVHEGDILFELDKDREELQVQEAYSAISEAQARARNIQTGARPAEIAALTAQLEDARAASVLAETEHTRLWPLVESGSLSRAEGDVLTANLRSARARVRAAEEAIEVAKLSGRDAEQAAADATVNTRQAAAGQVEWALDQRTVISRVSGRIEAVYQRPGELVSAGSPVLALLPPDARKVRFFVAQQKLTQFQLGETVLVTADAETDAIEATISFIAGEAEFTPPVIYSVESRDKLVFLVEARLPAGSSLTPGLPVDIILP